MSTTIGHDGTKAFWVLMILMSVFLLWGCLTFIPDSVRRDNDIAEYCELYATQPQDEIPARCLRYFK